MKPGIRVWILGLILCGSALASFKIYSSHQNFPPGPKASVEGAKTEAQAVKSVIDGDTLILENNTKVRLIGINAPEANQPNFLEAKKKLEDLVLGKSIQVEYDVEKKDMYERTLAYVYAENVFVNLEMIKSGMSVVETIQPNSLYADSFVKAQDTARQNCLGMWDGLCHPGPSACAQLGSVHKLSSSAAMNEEWVEVVNTCSSSQNLQGYLVKDASASNSYTFKSVNLFPKKSVKLHSGCGTDTDTDVYWKCPERSVPVWNNLGDFAYLFDKTGILVSEIHY